MARDGRKWSPLLWLEAGCVIAFIAWAGYFRLDIASYAEGQVIPAGQVKRVQHLEGGIVSGIRVAEGQRVAEGEVMVEMESVLSGADLSELRLRHATLEARSLHVDALLEGRAELVLPADLQAAHPAIATDVRQAFNAYRNRYRAEVTMYETRIVQRRAEIEETRQRLTGLQARSGFIANQVRISQDMLRRQLTSEYDHLQLQKEQAQIDSDRDTTLVTQRRAVTALDEAEATLAAFRSKEAETLRRELLEINTELNTLRERLKKPADSYERTVIRAPAAGNVMTLFVKNNGAVLAPGGIVATIVPEGESLLIEARLAIADIGFVTIGAPGRLTLAGGVGGFSTIDAEVVHISPDAVIDEKSGASYYVVRLRPQTLVFERGGEIYPLRPGVKVLATILIGSRTVLATLMDTFIDHGATPLAER